MAKTNKDVIALIKAYDKYTELLVSSERSLIGLAYAHGFTYPSSEVERGERLRKKIHNLKTKITGIV